jgi:hypothetical protein
MVRLVEPTISVLFTRKMILESLVVPSLLRTQDCISFENTPLAILNQSVRIRRTWPCSLGGSCQRPAYSENTPGQNVLANPDLVLFGQIARQCLNIRLGYGHRTIKEPGNIHASIVRSRGCEPMSRDKLLQSHTGRTSHSLGQFSLKLCT